MLQLKFEPQTDLKVHGVNTITMEARMLRTLRASPYQPRTETHSTILIPQPYFFSLILSTSFSSFVSGRDSVGELTGLFSASIIII